jgi:hypothetical protein
MEDISRLITIDDVVNEALYTIPESQRTLYNKRRFLDFAIREMRNLSITIFKHTIRREKVTPDVNNRIDFPPDMEHFISLNVQLTNGTVWPLTRRNDMVMTKTVAGLDESLDATDGEGVDLPTEQEESFTAKGGVNLYGYYTLDDRNEEIIVNATLQDELLLEYVSSGISNTGVTYIPAIYTQLLVACILFRDAQYDKTIPANTKLLYEKAVKDEKREMKKILTPSIQELLDAWNNKSMVR